MEAYFSAISIGALAVVLTAVIGVLFLSALGWIVVWGIGWGKAIFIHAGIAAREPREKIIRKYRRIGAKLVVLDKRRRPEDTKQKARA